MSLDRERLKVRAFERRWQRAGEDVCSLYAPIVTEGGTSGDSVTPGLVPAAVGLECVYRGAGQNSQVVVGGRSYLASHEVELERTADTKAITPEYQIKVAARISTATVPAAVTWRNLVNCTSTGHNLTKTGAAGNWDAGGFSVEGLTGDGYIEFTGLATAQDRIIGLSVDDPNADFGTIDYALYLDVVGQVGVYQNGGIGFIAGNYINSTVLKIERSGTTIRYYVNGVLKYTSLVASTGTLYVDTSIKTPASIIPSVTLFPIITTEKAELVFEHPVLVEQPFNPVLKLAASLVIQGYQQ